MSTPIRRLKDANAKAGGQKPADAELEGHRSENQRGPKSASGGPRPAGSGAKLVDK